MRKAARHTAGQFIWEEVMKNLIQKLEFRARIQGLLATPRRTPVPEPSSSEFQNAAPNGQAVLVGSS